MSQFQTSQQRTFAGLLENKSPGASNLIRINYSAAIEAELFLAFQTKFKLSWSDEADCVRFWKLAQGWVALQLKANVRV